MTPLIYAARLARTPFQIWSRLTRGITLGVRGVAQDDEGRILLVEHTYVPGWHLPGGGVESDETAADALTREMAEEAGLRLTEPPRLVSVHDNSRRFRGDHVLVFRCGAFETCEPNSRGEIARRAWFHLNALPKDVTCATRARLDEVLSGAPLSPFW